jgi:succinyl-CoA synthetase beta subunit
MEIKGLEVHKILVVPAADIASESYLGLIMDRETQRPVFMVSAAGGVDIEEVAATSPEKIVRLPVDPTYGLLPHQALGLGFALYRDFNQVKAAAKIMEQLYAVFTGNGWPGARARCQDRDRRQRALLATRSGPDARRHRRGGE